MPNPTQLAFLLSSNFFSKKKKEEFVKVANITNLVNFMPNSVLLMQLDVDPASVLTGRTLIGVAGYEGESAALNGVYTISSISTSVTINTLDASPAYSGPRVGQGFIYYVEEPEPPADTSLANITITFPFEASTLFAIAIDQPTSIFDGLSQIRIDGYTGGAAIYNKVFNVVNYSPTAINLQNNVVNTYFGPYEGSPKIYLVE